MSEWPVLVSAFILLLGHWVADFVCQSDRVAQNKSKSNKVLAEHCVIYTIVVAAFTVPMVLVLTLCYHIFLLHPLVVMSYLFITHFITDYFTSRLNDYLLCTEQRHWFFVSIGFDQLIHFGVLLCLLALFLL